VCGLQSLPNRLPRLSSCRINAMPLLRFFRWLSNTSSMLASPCETSSKTEPTANVSPSCTLKMMRPSKQELTLQRLSSQRLMMDSQTM
jgi:hypothetical protein